MQSVKWFGNPFVAGVLIPFFLALLTNRWKFLASPNDWTEESGFYGLDLLVATGGLQLIELATAIREEDYPEFLTLAWASVGVVVALLEVAAWLRKHGYSRRRTA
jgi:hypothetical protein